MQKFSKRGDPVHVLLSATFIDVQDGKYIFTTATDITPRKMAEEALRSKADELKKLNLQKDFLMQELNHRVKNNLAMINSLLVLKEANAGGSTDFADIMIDNPRTLGLQIVSELVRQLSGTIELRRSPHPEFRIQFPVEKNLS